VSAPLPPAGLRILAFTQLGAGSFGMQVLGDLGAETVARPLGMGGDEVERLRAAGAI